jgi:Tfp pilus assembly protein PilX
MAVRAATASVRAGELAVHAVARELVSAVEFAANSEKYREFRGFKPFFAIAGRY